MNVPGPCEAADASAALLKRIDDLEKELAALKARPPVEYHFHGPAPTPLPPPEPFQYPRYPTYPLSPTVWCNTDVAGLTTVD